MVAICSDLDDTPDAAAYYEQARFLNTTEQTEAGPGLGLEIGNTIYFDMAKDQFAYWNTDDHGRAMVRNLIKSGHVDCLHSFGDLAEKRLHAGRALDELEAHGCKLKVWIDHAVAPTNFGADIMRGHGDEREHPAYHADLTTSYGIEYVWRGRVTSVIGQDRPLNFRGIYQKTDRFSSFITLTKEVLKQGAARIGNRKYRLHRSNRILNPSRLRNGTPVLEFLRSNPHSKGVSYGDTGDGIGEVLSERFLDRLVKRRGTSIIYTHLGKITNRIGRKPFAPKAIRGFQRLSEFEQSRKILVTTTRRLLDYRRVVNTVQPRVTRVDGRLRIDLLIRPEASGGAVRNLKASELDGLTLSVPSGEPIEVWHNAQKLPAQCHSMPCNGATIVTLPWTRLAFPN